MQDALFSLGPSGRRLLEDEDVGLVSSSRQVPKQLDHLLGINDLRIAAELSLTLSYFFAYWELPALKWDHPLIPDAIFAVGDRTFAAEFDRGQENVRFFIKTKLPFYRHGLAGFPLHRVIVVVDRQARLHSLSAAIGNTRDRFVFTTIDRIREHGLAQPIFFETAQGRGVNLL
jgi:hypothetical protein